MKTTFTLLLIISATLSSYSQDWVHQGSKWHYAWNYFYTSAYSEYTYVNDTIVDHQPCHQLSSVDYTSDAIGPTPIYVLDTTSGLPIFTYSSADTVFFYYRNLNQWQPVYFFGAHAGDSLTMPNAQRYTSSVDTFRHIVVDTTGVMMIHSASLRFYTFHITDSCSMGWFGRGTVIERLGIQYNDIMPFWHCITDDYAYSLCSYQDDSFALYPPQADCTDLPTGIKEISKSNISICPTPAQNQIILKIDQITANMTASIYDLSGRVLMHIPLESSEQNIFIGDVAEGIYLLTIYQNSKLQTTRKIVIRR